MASNVTAPNSTMFGFLELMPLSQLFLPSGPVSAPAAETAAVSSAAAASTMSIISAICLALFVLLFLFRYIRTVVSIYSWNTYKPKPILPVPSYTSADITVVIPTTFKKPEELLECLLGILRCEPAKIIVVTAGPNVSRVRELFAVNSLGSNVKCIGVGKLNKREQILKALPLVKTRFITLADDDVFWPTERYLDYVLAIFEDEAVGAGGTRQRVKRQAGWWRFWNILGISYLERRVWNNCATNAMDGSLSTLSGRTATYRASILKDEAFEKYFRNDTWRGRPLNSDDDKCLTRYVYKHGWKIVLQFAEEATLETTVENDSGYLHQCLRWARAHWRGNFTVMENEKYWKAWEKNGQWWGYYYIYLGSYQTPALLWDTGLLFFLAVALWGASPSTFWNAIYSFGAWVFFTKNMKMIPHFRRYPQDLVWIPLLVAFSYFHGALNIYAANTMTNTVWGGKDLKALEKARAGPDGAVALVKDATNAAEKYREPTPGKDPVDCEYFTDEELEKGIGFEPDPEPQEVKQDLSSVQDSPSE